MGRKGRVAPAALAAAVLAALAWGLRARRGAVDAGRPVRLTHLGDVGSFLWSHTGPRLLAARGGDGPSGARWVVDWQTGVLERRPAMAPAERAALVGEFAAVHPAKVKPPVSPDGRRVAAGEPDTLVVVERTSRRRALLLRGGLRPAPRVDARWLYGPCWSPDGHRLAFTALEIRSGLPAEALTLLRSVSPPAAGPALAARAEAWRKLGARVGLWVVNADGTDARRILDHGLFQPEEGLTRARLWLQWSPDGRQIGFIRGGDVWAVVVR